MVSPISTFNQKSTSSNPTCIYTASLRFTYSLKYTSHSQMFISMPANLG